MTALLQVQDLSVDFDVPGRDRVAAVRNVSFTVAAGERFGLVGESGCGKSTTLFALMGLLPPNATVGGRVLLDGVDMLAAGEASVRPYRWRDVAMVFQGAMNAFNPVKTIGWQIVEAMELHQVASGQQAKARARELLEMVGIPGERADRYPHEFSGGMRQRAAIAMALSCNPRLLLADEPTTALDVMVQAQVLDLLTKLADELDLAIILVTHDLPLVAQVCSRAAIMYAGEVAEMGVIDTLYRAPAHPYTRLLFAAVPDIDDDVAVGSIPGSPPRLDVVEPGCSFQPRCDRALDVCRTVRPPRVLLGADHEVACHLHPAGGGA